MGIAKSDMIRKEELVQSAIAVAIKTGAISECEYHSGTYTTNYDDEANKIAYATYMNKVKSGELGCTTKEAQEAMHTALNDAGDECYSCAKMREE